MAGVPFEGADAVAGQIAIRVSGSTYGRFRRRAVATSGPRESQRGVHGEHGSCYRQGLATLARIWMTASNDETRVGDRHADIQGGRREAPKHHFAAHVGPRTARRDNGTESCSA